MAAYGNLGYLTAFDGLTIVDGSSSKVPVSEAPVGETGEVIDRFQELHNGTVMDYDGTSASDIAPGRITQVVIVTATVGSYYGSAIAKIGEEGTLTKTKFPSGTETCTARCMSVEPLGRSLPGKNIAYFLWTFQGKTNWV